MNDATKKKKKTHLETMNPKTKTKKKTNQKAKTKNKNPTATWDPCNSVQNTKYYTVESSHRCTEYTQGIRGDPLSKRCP